MTKLTLVRKQRRINIMKKNKCTQAFLIRHWVKLSFTVN